MSEYSTQKFFSNPFPKFTRLDLELTQRCNNRCVHCYVNIPQHDKFACAHEQPFEFYEKVLFEAKMLGVNSIVLTGGEPLLHPDFCKIYAYAQHLHFKITIFTNATLIDEKLIELFRSHLPQKIDITLYGADEAAYEKVSRLKGSWQAAWRGVQLLRDNNLPFSIKGVRLPFNHADVEKLQQLVKDQLKIQEPIHFISTLSMRATNINADDANRINNLRQSAEQAQQQPPDDLISKQQELLQLLPSLKPAGSHCFSCGAGFTHAAINPYGQLQMCLAMRHSETFYDLKNGSLQDALENFFPKIRKFSSQNSDYLHKCARCFIKKLCMQCSAYAWAEHGEYDKPVDYFCEQAHAQARWAGLLNEDEYGWQVEKHDKIRQRFQKKMNKLKEVE